jgi:transmembrane 9 superfamily protein 3
VKPGHQLAFTYEVVWKETKTPFDKRFDKYLDPTFFQHRIHWFSIFNSFMMVLFLVGLVWMILLRTLNKDYQRYHGKDSVDVEADVSRSAPVTSPHPPVVGGNPFAPPVALGR